MADGSELTTVHVDELARDHSFLDNADGDLDQTELYNSSNIENLDLSSFHQIGDVVSSNKEDVFNDGRINTELGAPGIIVGEEVVTERTVGDYQPALKRDCSQLASDSVHTETQFDTTDNNQFWDEERGNNPCIKSEQNGITNLASVEVEKTHNLEGSEHDIRTLVPVSNGNVNGFDVELVSDDLTRSNDNTGADFNSDDSLNKNDAQNMPKGKCSNNQMPLICEDTMQNHTISANPSLLSYQENLFSPDIGGSTHKGLSASIENSCNEGQESPVAVTTHENVSSSTPHLALQQEAARRPMQERPVEERPMEERPMEERPMEERPMNDQAAEERSVEEQPAEERPMEVKPVDEQPVEKLLMAPERPIEEQPVEEGPVENRPMEEQLVTAKLVEEQPVELKPVEEGPAELKPVEEEPVELKPVEVKPVEELHKGVTEPEKQEHLAQGSVISSKGASDCQNNSKLADHPSSVADMNIGSWVYLLGHQGLKKRVLKSGEKDKRPDYGQLVIVNCCGRLTNGTEIDRLSDLELVVGESDFIPAFDFCLPHMDKGEVCELFTDHNYAYGEHGRKPDVPKNASVTYTIELLSVEKQPEYSKLPVVERLQRSNVKRERGNYLYERKESIRAIQAYSKALHIIDDSSESYSANSTSGELQMLLDARVKCHNNLAAAQLHVEQWDAALQSINYVLRVQPDNVKALFRKAKCLTNKGEHDAAIYVLRKAAKLEPETKIIQQELARLEKWSESQKKSQKAMYEKMMGQSKKQKEKAKDDSWKRRWWFGLAAAIIAVSTTVSLYRRAARS